MQTHHKFQRQQGIARDKSGSYLLVRSEFWVSFFTLLILLSGFLLTQPVAAAVRAAPPTPNMSKIDTFITTTMQEKHIPGVALAVVHDDQALHLRGFGKADESGRAVTAQTPFQIGSMSKSFTALAIMQLVEQGKVDLNAPVQRYLPWFRLANAAVSTHITVASLLHHTSGIPGEGNAPFELEALANPSLGMEQFIRSLQTVSPDRPIGSFEYSNTNYAMLGLIVQTVSGQPYATYIQQHILAPLQMQHTFLSFEEAQRHGAAQGYNWFFGVPRPVDRPIGESMIPAGGLISSAEDLSHYLIAMMNGGRYGTARVLSAQGVQTLQAPSTPIPAATFPGVQGGYGMGWIHGTYYGVPAIFHSGTTPSFKAFMVMEPQRHWGAVLLTDISSQVATEPFDTIRSGVTHLLVGQDPEPVAEMTINTLYLLIDLVLALLSILIVWSVLRLPRWYHKLSSRLGASRHRGWFIARQVLRASGEIILGLAFLEAPLLLFRTYSVAFVTMPDLSGWAVGAGIVLLATGLLRGALLWRRLYQEREMDSQSPSDTVKAPSHTVTVKA